MAKSSYVEKTALLLDNLAQEVALTHADNDHFRNIARQTGNHAAQNSGFDFSILAQLLSLLGGGTGLAVGGTALLGVLSPGLRKKKKS